MIALDTNILVYAAEVGEKGALAKSIMLRAGVAGAILPVQVLLEFANVCRRKSLLAPDDVRWRVADHATIFTVVTTSLRHLDLGIEMSSRYRLAFFDALICAVAADAGATTILSEDMHDGLRLGSLTIVNPFNVENRERLSSLLPE